MLFSLVPSIHFPHLLPLHSTVCSHAAHYYGIMYMKHCKQFRQHRWFVQTVTRKLSNPFPIAISTCSIIEMLKFLLSENTTALWGNSINFFLTPFLSLVFSLSSTGQSMVSKSPHQTQTIDQRGGRRVGQPIDRKCQEFRLRGRQRDDERGWDWHRRGEQRRGWQCGMKIIRSKVMPKIAFERMTMSTTGMKQEHKIYKKRINQLKSEPMRRILSSAQLTTTLNFECDENSRNLCPSSWLKIEGTRP